MNAKITIWSLSFQYFASNRTQFRICAYNTRGIEKTWFSESYHEKEF